MVPLETCSRQDQFCLITCYIFNLSTLYHYIYILHTTVYHLSTLLYWAAQNILLYVFIKIYLFIRMCVCLISIYVHFVFGYSFVFLHWVCQDLVVQGCVLLWECFVFCLFVFLGLLFFSPIVAFLPSPTPCLFWCRVQILGVLMLPLLVEKLRLFFFFFNWSEKRMIFTRSSLQKEKGFLKCEWC